MGLPSLVDINNYCYTLSEITNVDVDKIKSIVIITFADVVLKNITFDEGEEKIIQTLLVLSNNDEKAPLMAL